MGSCCASPIGTRANSIRSGRVPAYRREQFLCFNPGAIAPALEHVRCVLAWRADHDGVSCNGDVGAEPVSRRGVEWLQRGALYELAVRIQLVEEDHVAQRPATARAYGQDSILDAQSCRKGPETRWLASARYVEPGT